MHTPFLVSDFHGIVILDTFYFPDAEAVLHIYESLAFSHNQHIFLLYCIIRYLPNFSRERVFRFC